LGRKTQEGLCVTVLASPGPLPPHAGQMNGERYFVAGAFGGVFDLGFFRE
jgi:hypothetical protein